MKRLFLILFPSVFFVSAWSQDKSPVKFGKISADDLRTTVYNIDKNADAVIIADLGSSEINGNLKGWFSIEFNHFKRIHVLKKNGYGLADVEISLYTDGDNEEELKNLRANTYNLENGKVITAKLDIKKSVFTTSVNKNHLVKKFTFPAVKEGSIIEFEYTINSDFIFNLQPWEFQGGYPCLWSEYNVSIPDFFYYIFLPQGNFTRKETTRQQTFRITNAASISTKVEPFISGVTDHRMIMKNVAAIEEDNFTSTIKNHIAKIEFQLEETRRPLPEKSYIGSWEDLCNDLLQDENFGGQLMKDNSWLNEDLKIALRGATTDFEKAKKIYRHIQSKFVCTDYNKLFTGQTLRNVLRNKRGSEAEINLLLIAMLRKAGLNADPVMLSTRSHGYVYSNYPVLDRFNYVISYTLIDSIKYYLDASRPNLGFGHLQWDCYNGHARIINEEASPVEFSPDSLIEKKVTFLFLSALDSNDLSGTMQQVPGYNESYFTRNRIKEQGFKNYYSEIEKDFAEGLDIKNYRISSLENPDEQLQISCEIRLTTGKNELLYINPMHGEGHTENPFISKQRAYPVEMPYALDEIYLMTMDVPKGYEVESLPASTRMNFDEEGKSFFEYIISNAGGVISLRSRIKMSRTFFKPDEYEILREFFDRIVSKQTEPIVFRRKK